MGTHSAICERKYNMERLTLIQIAIAAFLIGCTSGATVNLDGDLGDVPKECRDVSFEHIRPFYIVWQVASTLKFVLKLTAMLGRRVNLAHANWQKITFQLLSITS